MRLSLILETVQDEVKLSAEEEDALSKWTTSEWKQIRNADKGNPVSSYIKNHYINFKNVIDRLPEYRGLVFRGISGLTREDLEDYRVGMPFSYGSYYSATKSLRLAVGYASKDSYQHLGKYHDSFGVVLITRDNAVDISGLGEKMFAFEEEVIIKPSDYKVSRTKDIESFRLDSNDTPYGRPRTIRLVYLG